MRADEREGYTQGELHAFLYATSASEGEDYAFRFHNATVKPTKLTKFKAIWEQNDNRAAMAFLRTRRTPIVDEEFIVDTDSPNVTPWLGPHFYDFGLLIGDRAGLDAVLPRSRVDHTWFATLNFNLGHTLWPKADMEYLEFNPHGRMMKIGTRLQENIWLGVLHRTFTQHDHRDNRRGRYPILDATTTALKPTHRLMITMFFAWALSSMNYADIHCNPSYPEPLTRATVNRSSDIL